MKYLITFFAVTIFASSSAFACSASDPAACKTQADCSKLGANYTFSANSATKCMLKTSQSTTDCSMVNSTAQGKTTEGASRPVSGAAGAISK